MLTSSSLELRGSAALSLATLGDGAGLAVLLELLEPEVYAAERAADARRWPAARVSESRVKALDALDLLGELPADRLAALREDLDASVRTRVLALEAARAR